MSYYLVIDGKEEPLILDNIKEALDLLKKFPDYRMKKFASKEEALSFSEPEKSEPKQNPDAFSPSLKKIFSNPKPKELTVIRRLVESEDYEEFIKQVWNNPRYLVSVCDAATILMAGPKYNAAHIAARRDSAMMMKALLETVSDYKFFRKLYPDDKPEIVQDAMFHTLDSYLNTPDSKQGFTPLHFACRVGHIEVVKVLLNYEELDITLRDTRGNQARDIIMETFDLNTDEEKERRKTIEDLFLIATLTNLTINKTPKNSPILTKEKD